MNEYKFVKEESHFPPQSKWRVDAKGYIYDMIYNFSKINSYVYEIRNSIWIDIWLQFRKRLLALDIDKYDFESRKEKYIFFRLRFGIKVKGSWNAKKLIVLSRITYLLIDL